RRKQHFRREAVDRRSWGSVAGIHSAAARGGRSARADTGLRVRVGSGVSRRALAALVELARPHGPDGPDVVPGPDPLWDLDVLRVRTRACAHGKGGTGGTRGRRR